MTRRATRFVVHLLGTLVGIAVILLAALAWRVTQGPIVLGNVTPYLEAALNSNDGAFRLGIDQAVLTWGDWEGTLEVKGYGLRGVGVDGQTAFAAREVAIDLALGPLLRGEFRPIDATVVRPWIRVVRDADGAVSLDISADRTAEGEAALIDHRRGLLGGEAIMDALLDAGDALPALQDLHQVSIVDADLWVDDLYLGVVWNAPQADIVLRHEGDDLRLVGDLLVRLDEDDVPVDVSAVYRRDDGRLTAHLGLQQMPVEKLADAVPALEPLAGIEAPVSGRVQLSMDRDLALLDGRFAVEAGSGTLNFPGFFAGPIPFSTGEARGEVGRGLSDIELHAFHLVTEKALVSGDATLDGLDPDSTFDLNVTIENLPVDALPEYWPLAASASSRQWVVEHMSGGTADSVVLNFDWRLEDLARGELPLEDFKFVGDVSGTTITYFGEMPAISGVDGRITIADDSMVAETQGGKLLDLTLGAGEIVIAPLSANSETSIGFAFDGPANDLAMIGTHPSLGVGEELDLGTEPLTGTATGRLDIGLPHLTGLSRGDITFELTADLSGVGLPSGFRDIRVQDAAGTLRADNASMDVAVDMSLDGVPFRAELSQAFVADAQPRRVLSLSGTIDRAALDPLGVSSLVDIEGAMPLDVDMVESWGGETAWDIGVDLTPADVAFPAISLDKPPGERGRFSLRLLDRGSGGVLIELLNLATEDVTVAGNGALAPDDLALQHLSFERVSFGRNDFAASLAVRGDGGYDIAVEGGDVDLVPFMNDLSSASGPELPPFHLEGRIDRVWLSDNDSLNAVAIKADYEVDRWEELHLTGELAGGAPMTMRIWRHDENERRFAHTAGDAGDAMRLFDLFDDARGGTIDIRARIDDAAPGRPVTGVMRIDEVTMTKTPILARILSLASFTSIANAVSGEGLVFNSALVPFEKHEDSVTINDARAYGPGIGITVEGDIDLSDNTLGLNGTLVPAYVVNSILGDLPIVGDILTGGDEGGGIFAVTYQVEGPYADPQVGVDPLSVLAPGYLRSIFTAPTNDEIGPFNIDGTTHDR